MSMEGRNNLDHINRNIMRVLSLYDGLDILQLWYELGENHLTVEGLADRLKSLMTQGVVKQIVEKEGRMRWAFKRGEGGDDQRDLQPG